MKNKKAFIGISVVIDLLVAILLIAAIAENGRPKKSGKAGSKEAKSVYESEETAGTKTDDEPDGTGKDDKKTDDTKTDDDKDTKTPTDTQAPLPTSAGTPVTSGNLTVSVRFDGMSANANAVQGIMDIKNNGGPLPLSELTTGFFLTSEGKQLVFECYHSAVNTAAGAYQALNNVSGEFSAFSGQDADTRLTIKYGDPLTLNAGDSLTVNFAIHSGDWSNLITDNDWSVKDPSHIVFYSGGNIIAGTEP